MKQSVLVPLLILLLVGVACLLGGPFLAWTTWAGEEAASFKLVGAKKCKMCHKKLEDGAQYTKWSEGPHAKAFETLASEEALAEAKKKGIENPQAAPECLQCHATAFSVMDDIENQKITLEEGVSCESCHGAGSGYYKKKTMTAVAAGDVEAASVGMQAPTEEVCVQCHRAEGNSFFKEFNFEERVKEIAHPKPEAAEAAE